MSKKTKAVVATCAIMAALSLHTVVDACQVDDFYLTKESTLAAATPEALNAARTALQANRAKVDDLVNSGTIVQVQEGTKVQVMERSFEWKMLKIKLPGATTSYWVKDGSLKQMDCK